MAADRVNREQLLDTKLMSAAATPQELKSLITQRFDDLQELDVNSISPERSKTTPLISKDPTPQKMNFTMVEFMNPAHLHVMDEGKYTLRQVI